MTSNSEDENKTDRGIPNRQSQHMFESECIQESNDSDNHSPYISDTSGSIDGQFRYFVDIDREHIPGSYFFREPAQFLENAPESEPSNPAEQSRLLHDSEPQKEQATTCEPFRTAIDGKRMQGTYNFVRLCNSCITQSFIPEAIYSREEAKSEKDWIKGFCDNIKVCSTASIMNGDIIYCYNRKCCQSKSDYKFTLKFPCKETLVDIGQASDKSNLGDSDDKRNLKDVLQKLHALPVQNTVDVNLLNITVLPVLRQMTESSQQPTNDTAPFPRFEPLLTIVNRIADGERVPPQTTMKYEMLRFCTLRSYPKENKPYITRLAQAGFYYANSGDEVVCYCCARRKRNWRETDNPMDVHREMNPNCRFLVNNLEVNVPIRNRDQGPSANSSLTGSRVRLPNDGNLESSAENSSQDNLQSITVSTSSGQNSRNLPNTARNGHTLEVANADTSVTAVREEHPLDNGRSTLTVVSGGRRRNQSFSANAADFPVSRTESQSSSRIAGEARPSALPKYPKYSSRTVRLTSFGDCGEIVVTPERLAEAGFFYAGFGDCVRCFQCGVGLRHWSEDDDPWIEHSRWSKECSFVRQIKGMEFVNLVQMAVQYSQNENRSEQTLSQDNLGAAGQQQTTAETGDTDPLMHTDAAQSVLEMGYDPHIIKRAIRAVLASGGRDSLNAANLMEKVLEIEESDAQQTSPPSETHTAHTENHACEPSTHESTVESRDTTHVSENTDESPEADEIRSETNNVEGRGSDSPTENGSEGAANTAKNEGTTHYRGTNTAREPDRDDEDNEPKPRKAVQSQKQDSSVNLLTGSSTSSSAVTGATGGEPSVDRRAHLLEQRRLKEENEKLKQQSVCTKCKIKDVCIVFLPCGHLVTCEDCAPSVRYCMVDKCGKYIKGTVRTYMS